MGVTHKPEQLFGNHWRPWMSAVALVLAVWGVTGAHWLAFPDNATPSAGQSGAVAAVAGLCAAAMLRLWDAWDQLRAARRATDARMARLDAALARAEAPDDDTRQELPPLDRQSALKAHIADFQRELEQLRDLKSTDGFEAAWRERFGPGAPAPDQVVGQLDSLLRRKGEREQA